jgi:hypothetical protein
VHQEEPFTKSLQALFGFDAMFATSIWNSQMIGSDRNDHFVDTLSVFCTNLNENKENFEEINTVSDLLKQVEVNQKEAQRKFAVLEASDNAL